MSDKEFIKYAAVGNPIFAGREIYQIILQNPFILSRERHLSHTYKKIMEIPGQTTSLCE